MESYKAEFIEFLVSVQALQFGEFTLKSGRISPYYFNSALFNRGALICRLGYFYAAAINRLDPQTNLVFGPAYKGIPLCIATVIALSEHFDKDIGYFFNRKEQKSHGDKGILVGEIPQFNHRIMMVDDVITDGITKREALKLVQQLSPALFSGIIVAVDRMESNTEGYNTIDVFQKDTGIPVHAIVSIREICDYLLDREINNNVYLNKDTFHKIEAYLHQFSARN